MTALPTSRIMLPDRLKNYEINPKWAAFKPIFCMFAGAGFHNMINGETPTNAGSYPTPTVGVGGRCFSNDGTTNVGLRYDREYYKAGDNHTVFMVIESATTPAAGAPIMGNGTSGGLDKPFNYRMIFDPGVTRGIRYGHDTGPSGDSWDFNFALKDQEPSTLSISLADTRLDYQIDGITGTHTLGVAPVSNTEGNFDLFMNTGSNTSMDGKIYLCIVFDEFIPNDVLYELHARPQDFFIKPKPSSGFVAASGFAINCTLESLTLTENQSDTDLDFTISAALESLALTDINSTVSFGFSVDANLESLTLTEFQSDTDLDFNISANLESLTLTEFQSDTDLDFAINGTLESLTLTENISSVSLGFAISANLESLTLTEFQSDTDLDVTISAGLESLTLTEFQSNTDLDYTVSANLESLTLTENNATVNLDVGTIISATLESLALTDINSSITFTGSAWTIQSNDGTTWTVQTNDSSNWTIQ